MSFIGFLSSPVSMPPVFDTTPCLDHLMEYEDCVIDVGTNKKQFFMPAWPTLWPGILDGKSNEKIDTRPQDMIFTDFQEKDTITQDEKFSQRQRQLLYECEEERIVVKACMRELIKLRRSPLHTSWDTAEGANMALD